MRTDKTKGNRFRSRANFLTCGRKVKLKSSNASRIAAKYGQRKYKCPVCGHWHLTKQKRGEA